ncbi:hypothetical protein [Streptomyces sp. cg2]|uniref:hypothetical protein n=1 Tax=Streptomyces sp. cg2 TaxID=3238799 RepID=UPI0034E1E716
MEPPVPPGLAELTAPQRALADFLRVDADLLAVATQASPAPPKEQARLTKKGLAPLIAALPEKEKNALLPRLALGRDPGLRTDLLHRLRATATPTTVPGHRSAAHLLDAAHALRTERRQRAEHARCEARAKHLTALAREAESTWQQIEAHIATEKTRAHDQAVALLAELRDAYAHTRHDTAASPDAATPPATAYEAFLSAQRGEPSAAACEQWADEHASDTEQARALADAGWLTVRQRWQQ